MDFKTTCMDQSISLDLEKNTAIAREEIPPAIEAFSCDDSQGSAIPLRVYLYGGVSSEI